MAMMRQVKLQRRSTTGLKEDVFWIDNELAKPGKRVIDTDGIVWIVAEVYNAKPSKELDIEYEAWREFARTLDGH
jgi:hypothetical protein